MSDFLILYFGNGDGMILKKNVEVFIIGTNKVRCLGCGQFIYYDLKNNPNQVCSVICLKKAKKNGNL